MISIPWLEVAIGRHPAKCIVPFPRCNMARASATTDDSECCSCRAKRRCVAYPGGSITHGSVVSWADARVVHSRCPWAGPKGRVHRAAWRVQQRLAQPFTLSVITRQHIAPRCRCLKLVRHPTTHNLPAAQRIQVCPSVYLTDRQVQLEHTKSQLL